jgi:hypothetical protein
MIKYVNDRIIFSILLIALLVITTFTSYLPVKVFADTPPTVSASPPAGTYTSAQSVTLTASAPGTIYYTTDGTTPTPSSTRGTSPVSLIVTNNSTLNFYAKNTSNIVGPISTVSYTINYSVLTQMNDTNTSFGISIYSGRQIQAEYVTPISSLVGKPIDSISIQLKKAGAPTGLVQVGVFNTDLSVKQLFGTIDPSTLPTAYKQFAFSLAPLQTYQIQPGDKIGMKFTGGDTSNFVTIMIDKLDTFDGTDSYFVSYTNRWNSNPTQDLYMILKTHVYYNGPTVSVSLPSGTYTGPQSVTLDSSVPGTIFYTTDGSPATLLSTHGPSPLSITVNRNSTLTFFAIDASNNVGPTYSNVDLFGVKKIYPDLPNGMHWFSSSFNTPRTVTNDTVDPIDPWLDFSHGSGNYTIHDGILSASPKYSASPERIYIHNPDLQSEWNDVEITAYGRNDQMDTSITDWTWSGISAFARTTHGTNGNENINLCDDRGYGGRLLLGGTFDFEKETAHHLSQGYAPTMPVQVWNTNMSLGQWVGYKFIVYDKLVSNIKGVQLEQWIDKNNDGNWVQISSFFDNGTNLGMETGIDSSCKTGVDPKLQLTHENAIIDSETGKPSLAVYFRTDGQRMSYKDVSVREITPP